MTEEPKKKKRSEKMSDSFVARLSRGMGTSDRLSALAADGRSGRIDRVSEPAKLTSMQTPQAHSFTRCPHCREYVPFRDTCRACGTPM